MLADKSNMHLGFGNCASPSGFKLKGMQAEDRNRNFEPQDLSGIQCLISIQLKENWHLSEAISGEITAGINLESARVQSQAEATQLSEWLSLL